MAKSTIPLKDCTSSMIAQHGYDASTGTLALTFRGKEGPGVPHECPCPPELYDEMCQAESIGKFFNAKIRGNAAMPLTKMVPDEAEIS